MKMTTTTRQVNGVIIVDISGQIVFGEESLMDDEAVAIESFGRALTATA